MQAQLSHLMYQILNDNIGAEVSCIALENGNIIEYRGILKKVLPFDGVVIDDDFVPFIGGDNVTYRSNSIREILHLENSKTLYLNADTLGYANGEREDTIKVK